MKHAVCYIAFTLLIFLSCAKHLTKVSPENSTSNKHQTRKSLVITTMATGTMHPAIIPNNSLSRSEFTNGIEQAPAPAATTLLIDSSGLKMPEPPAEVSQPATVITPVFGGSVRLYTQRAFIDENIAAMLSPFPFDKKSFPDTTASRTPGYLQVKDVADKGVMLSFAPTILNGAGRSVSVFDLVTGWSDFTKKHPAEARSLFRYASGIDQFIGGREAVLSGFQIIDDKTIVIQFSKTDTNGLARLCSSRLFPPNFKLGSYFVKAETLGAVTLSPNSNYPFGKPFLSGCEITLGGNPNPFLSYSMRRFDAMTIFSLKDLDYARRKALDQSNLITYANDRYFLSLTAKSIELRQFIRRALNKKQILATYIKAEGVPLGSIETDSLVNEIPDSSANKTLTTPASLPVSILFHSDDPVSALIAEKLMADLGHAGLSCILKGCITQEYERSLIKRDYAIAVGWAPSSILFDKSERLRMATLWFNDECKEQLRIDNAFEIPLFSIKTFLLTSKKIFFADSSLASMFVKEL